MTNACTWVGRWRGGDAQVAEASEWGAWQPEWQPAPGLDLLHLCGCRPFTPRHPQVNTLCTAVLAPPPCTAGLAPALLYLPLDCYACPCIAGLAPALLCLPLDCWACPCIAVLAPALLCCDTLVSFLIAPKAKGQGDGQRLKGSSAALNTQGSDCPQTLQNGLCDGCVQPLQL